MEKGTIVGGRYEIELLLGAGAIADAYLARDRTLGASIALKILHPHLAEEDAVVDAFRREVAVSRLVDHSAVARTYELGMDEVSGAVYLSMEYYPGGDLERRILESGRLDAAEVTRLGGEVLGALAAAHRRGIVHRDVKPHNILIDAGGGFHLTDFGLARSSDLVGLEGDARSAGTPEYLAPESAASDYADARSDLYSFGVVLYEAVTGSLPFRASSPYELARMHAEEIPVPPSAASPDLPPALEMAILRSLEKDPARRFQTADELAAALAAPAGRPPPAQAETHPCPACGAPVSDGFPYCFACRREPLYLVRAPGGRRERWRVVVTGPGKPGDQLSHELRRRCLEELRDIEADLSRLERRLPRVPFVAVSALEEEGAGLLARRLAERGLEAAAVGPGRWSEAARRVRRLMRRKDVVIGGRLFGIVAASSGGSFSGLGRSLSRPDVAAALFALFGAGLLAVPVATVIHHRLPLARWRERGGASAARRYLALARTVRNPALQSVTRRVVVRLREILALSPGSSRAPGDMEALVLRAADWIECCQLLDDRLQALRSQPVAGRAEAGIAPAGRSLDDRRELERARDALLDRIFAFSSRLDRLWAAAALRRGRGAGGELRDLERAAEEAADAVRAVREVEEAML